MVQECLNFYSHSIVTYIIRLKNIKIIIRNKVIIYACRKVMAEWFSCGYMHKNFLLILWLYFWIDTLFFPRITYTLVYFGFALTTGDLAGDPYLNFFLSSVVELPARIFPLFILKRSVNHEEHFAMQPTIGIVNDFYAHYTYQQTKLLGLTCFTLSVVRREQ